MGDSPWRYPEVSPPWALAEFPWIPNGEKLNIHTGIRRVAKNMVRSSDETLHLKTIYLSGTFPSELPFVDVFPLPCLITRGSSRIFACQGSDSITHRNGGHQSFPSSHICTKPNPNIPKPYHVHNHIVYLTIYIHHPSIS